MKKMQDQFAVSNDKNSLKILNPDDGNIWASLEINEWESNFFKRKIGTLSINDKALKICSEDTVNNIFDTLLSYAAEVHYDLISLNLDVLGLSLIPLLEEKGLRLVDTRITFITLMDKKEIKHFSSEIGMVCCAKKDDLEDILRLTKQSFADNDGFFSRYKNLSYFTKEETIRFFSAWITNHLEDKDSLFAVIKDDSNVVAYFIYKRAERYKGKRLYKGILTAVDPKYQGHKVHLAMQSFLYDHFPEDQFYLDNTTQLTNFAVVKNHMTSQKKLNQIGMTFYWSKNG